MNADRHRSHHTHVLQILFLRIVDHVLHDGMLNVVHDGMLQGAGLLQLERARRIAEHCPFTEHVSRFGVARAHRPSLAVLLLLPRADPVHDPVE